MTMTMTSTMHGESVTWDRGRLGLVRHGPHSSTGGNEYSQSASPKGKVGGQGVGEVERNR